MESKIKFCKRILAEVIDELCENYTNQFARSINKNQCSIHFGTLSFMDEKSVCSKLTIYIWTTSLNGIEDEIAKKTLKILKENYSQRVNVQWPFKKSKTPSIITVNSHYLSNTPKEIMV
jgi:hypothetical protein